MKLADLFVFPFGPMSTLRGRHARAFGFFRDQQGAQRPTRVTPRHPAGGPAGPDWLLDFRRHRCRADRPYLDC